MRPFEILILLALLFAVLWPAPNRPRPADQSRSHRPLFDLSPSGLALLFILIHLVVERYRWQMVPAYALAGVLFALALRRIVLRPPSAQPTPRFHYLGFAIGLLFLAIAAALPALFPVPRLPTPTGPYRVGTITFHLIDSAREELYSSPPGGPRELMVQMWYPSNPPAGAKPAPWMDHVEIVGPAISRFLDLPPFFLDHIALASTHSYRDAPAWAAQSSYPVILFSHGWGGVRADSTFQTEELASHGYVVASIEHTYGAVATVFPDGRVALQNPDALPEGVSQAYYDCASNLLVTTWVADQGFVLDQLAEMNADAASPFAGRLDLTRIGVMGHSTGGGAAAEFCARDSRCKAGLAMDAWLEPVSRSVIADGLPQPFLFMRSEGWTKRTGRNGDLQTELLGNLRGGGYEMTIAGTKHFDFTDLPLLSPLSPYLGLKGPIDGKRVVTIINAYTLAFFDHALQGEESALLEGNTAMFLEVKMRVVARK